VKQRDEGNYPLLEIGALPLPTKQPPTLTDVASNNRTSAIDFIMFSPLRIAEMQAQSARLWLTGT